MSLPPGQVFPPGHVWIASYPKSGNTWMRILLSNLLSGSESPEDINNLALHDGMACNREQFAEQTLLDSSLLRPHEIEDLLPAVHDANTATGTTARFVKVHDVWRCLPDGRPVLGRGARAALYLVRDPRDVAISFAFHQARTVDQVIERLNRPGNFLAGGQFQFPQQLDDWSGHVRSWLDQTVVRVHLIRYEDLRADTCGVFRRALEFLGAAFPDELAATDAVSRAVRHADFSELRRQESAKGFRERGPEQAMFFREGRSGAWREQLSNAQVCQIESAHAETMARLGYELVTKGEGIA